jgi:hypothetical protein
MASSYFVDCLDELFFPSELRPIHACWFWQWWVAGDPLKIYGKCNSLRKKNRVGNVLDVHPSMERSKRCHDSFPHQIISILGLQSYANKAFVIWGPSELQLRPSPAPDLAGHGVALFSSWSIVYVPSLTAHKSAAKKTTRESNRHVAPGMVGPMQAVVAQQHLLARKERDSCKDTCRFNSFEHQKRLVGGFNPPDKY